MGVNQMGIIVAGVAWHIHTHLSWLLCMYAPSDTVHMYQINLSLLVYNKHLCTYIYIIKFRSYIYVHMYVQNIYSGYCSQCFLLTLIINTLSYNVICFMNFVYRPQTSPVYSYMYIHIYNQEMKSHP